MLPQLVSATASAVRQKLILSSHSFWNLSHNLLLLAGANAMRKAA
ncbi:hypothetical protein Deipr_0533 [Deinococcus proteolyticus MRP]|uniref:Uncharacterized protein n=1 Tax=Deinococcus proteolyticus (strain ATCC 35074 / DSM 20540 / JCM 6276 / NBRC 101906 / NCIMB 13154 / VKM Ac-1939 / CCM 2703 / MRP) TaxID=693977 RepID=F0RKK6_DEIPM|nr:hypothetical protein Deipr_0533 [Deinococcus proteolyticus MRP]